MTFILMLYYKSKHDEVTGTIYMCTHINEDIISISKCIYIVYTNVLAKNHNITGVLLFINERLYIYIYIYIYIYDTNG